MSGKQIDGEIDKILIQLLEKITSEDKILANWQFLSDLKYYKTPPWF